MDAYRQCPNASPIPLLVITKSQYHGLAAAAVFKGLARYLAAIRLHAPSPTRAIHGAARTPQGPDQVNVLLLLVSFSMVIGNRDRRSMFHARHVSIPGGRSCGLMAFGDWQSQS
jgi:hypothetical protein